MELLRRMVSLPHHNFWTDDVPVFGDTVPRELLFSHRQVSDAYLLGLCIRNGGKLVTLDRGVAALLPGQSPHRAALEILIGDN